MPSAASRTSSALGGSSSSGGRVRAEKLERASNSRLDRCRRRAVGPGDEQAELVEHRPVAPGREDVEERLRAEDLPDRRRERRPARLRANADDLDEGVEQPIAGRVRAQVRVERGDEPCGEVVLGGAHRDARRERRQRLVPDVLVDDVRRLPEPVDVHTRCRDRGRRAPRRATPRRFGAARARADRRRSRRGRRRPASRRARWRAPCRLRPARRGRPASRSPRRGARRAPASRAGAVPPVGSLRSTRDAPSSPSRPACSTSASTSPVRPGL